MKLLFAELSLVMPLDPGSALAWLPPEPSEDKSSTVEVSSECDEPRFEDLFAEVPAGEFDAASVPMETGIVWYGTWEQAMAERDRTGKPVLLHFGSPRRPTDKVCVPGAW